ncbi:MAG: Ig-like domain-containing protein [Pseudomonadota bacterium]
MTYCPPNHNVQTYEFSALTGADVLQGSDTELSCGDCFTMPTSATACIEVTDNDGSLSGDAYNNEWGDDHSWQIADIKVDGNLVHDDQKIYAEEYYVLHDQNGNCYYMVEIEVAGEAGSDLDDFYAFIGDVPPAGSELTVVGKGNVCGNWIDYRDLSAGLKWDFDEDGKLTVEAEDMALRGYKVDDVHAASGGEVIRLKKAEGTASVAFGGETGTYDLELAYIDENDGEGSIEIWVNGTLVHEIDLTANNNGNGGDWSSISTVKVEDILISQGDEIELRGTRDAWEFARIDALTFCEKPPVAQNEPPVALDDAFTVAETSSTILDILGNDFDPDGDVISLVSFTQPSEGSVRLDENGQVIFETGTDFAGLIDGQTATVSFQYQIADEAGLQSEATVTVTVIGEGACPPPVRFSDLATLPSGQDYTVNFDAPLELCGEDPDFSISVNFGDTANEQYNFVYVIDVSTSTGVADSFTAGQTVLEAEVAALKALTEDILDIGIPADAVTVTIIPFSSTDSTQPGLFQAKTFGGAGNDVLDQAGVDTFLDALTPGGETDYLAAIGATTQSVQTLEAAFGDANNQVYFLSDGDPTPPGSQPPFLLDIFSTQLRSEASVHAIGLGTDVSTTFLDPLDNTPDENGGLAEIVTDPAALANSLGRAPFDAGTILGATLTFLDDTGAQIDSFDFTASDFSETPLGYELDIASVAGLGVFAGQTTKALLDVSFDEDGDLVADDTISFDVDLAGQAPESLDI